MKAIVTFAAFLTLAVVATPAQAFHPFRRNNVQRIVVKQQFVAPQPIYVAPAPFVVAQPQVQYSQPIILEQRQNVCYPQAQIVAPVYSQQVVGGSACFFAR